ncbi:retrovirus-related pol polyprotein from transposon TNT 1-94 [Tanacetum coccineum]
MAAVNDVPQLVDKKGGRYANIAPKLELRKFNKWKKRMLCYLARMKPYYLKCIKDGPFHSKTTEGDAKPESQWTPDERRVVISMGENSDDEVDERSSEEYLRDLDIEYHERSLLANSKCFIKRRNNFSGQKTNENTECYKCGNKGHFARDCFSKTSEPSYKSPVNNYSSMSKGFQPKFTPKLIQSSSNSNNQADAKFQKDYKAEYKKMNAKLALLEASPSSSQNLKSFQPKNKGLVAETFDWGEEEVSDEEEVTQVKVLMALADDELTVGKSHAYNGEWVDITIRKCRDELLILKQAKLDAITFQIQNTKLTKLNHALQEQLKEEKKINEKWLTSSKKDHMTSDDKMYISSLKRSESYKAQPYQYASSSKQILKAKAKPFPPCTHYGFNDHRPSDCRNYPKCEIYGSYDHSTLGHNRVIQIRGGVLAESSQSNKSSIGVKCNAYGRTVHSTSDHNEFDHFKRGEKIQAAKAREPTKNGCSRSMTGVKSYLHKYVEQPSLKVVFGDNSSCITKGYGLINCGGTIFNANKEIVLISPRRNDVHVFNMSSLTPNRACFFAKASKSVNWLWHKRLSHLNFKNINKLAKQNKVLGLPSLVYSKDKPCTTCEKGKHHRASFKTKQNFSTRKCLHLLHMDLKKSQAPEMIMSFIKMVENQNDVKVKQIKTDNETEFRNHELESFCDEKGISHNFFSPYTPEQNGVAEGKNKTLIEAARTMLNGSVLSKHFWTDAVRIVCYTQNRSIIVKRHDKTSYEIFREKIPDISYFHVFGCPVFNHNHKDHLGKFDAKAEDGYFLGYSSVSKAFRVYNTRRQQI